MKSILLAGILQGVLLSFLLIVRGKKHKPNLVLGVLMLTISIHLIFITFEGTDFFTSYPHFSHITWLIPALYGPLILLFTLMVTQRRQFFVKTDLFIFTPFTLYLLVLLPYYISSADEKLIHMNHSSSLYGDDFGILNQLLNLFHIVFISTTIIIYYKNIIKWKETYSGSEITRLHWLLSYLYITLIIILLSIFIFYSKKFEINPFNQIFPYHFFAIVVLIYWIGYKVLFHPEIFELSSVTTALKQVVNEETRYETFVINEESANNLESKIRQAMETDRLFLNPDLSLSQLAEHIGSSRHHISQVLNVHMATNFYDFINGYRVDEFIRKLNEPGNEFYTLLALAHESGFNSKATFNSVFKKNKGLTPSVFFRNMKQAQE